MPIAAGHLKEKISKKELSVFITYSPQPHLRSFKSKKSRYHKKIPMMKLKYYNIYINKAQNISHSKGESDFKVTRIFFTRVFVSQH